MLSIILVAAGLGKRMQSDIPKQFIELNGKMILRHTLEAFLFLKEDKEFIIVLHQDYLAQGKKVAQAYPNEKIKIIAGGTERFYSVHNAIKAVQPQTEFILIHDGVRPFVSKEMIERGLTCCYVNGNAIPQIKLRDSIRLIQSNGDSEHKNRKDYGLVQTPQMFSKEIIEEAYSANYSETFTDDASVLEHNNNKVHLYIGDEKNIKITVKEDLTFAQYLLDKK